jgi:ribose/xylose/arabinose/galactoside ABC-type transport system permease subunit
LYSVYNVKFQFSVLLNPSLTLYSVYSILNFTQTSVSIHWCGNETAARLAGINVNRVKGVVILAMMSIMCGAALLVGGSVLHLIREPAAFLFVGSGRAVGLPIPIFIFMVTA